MKADTTLHRFKSFKRFFKRDFTFDLMQLNGY